mgnify:CR=1 FL=1
MYTVKKFLSLIGVRSVSGNIDTAIESLNLCNRKTQFNAILSYATSDKYMQSCMENRAVKAMIVPVDCTCYEAILNERNGAVIYSETPEKDFYVLHEALCRCGDFYEKYDFPSEFGVGCDIHPSTVIYDGVKIGNYVKIGANTVVKPGTIIEDCVTIGCNSVIGSEGFQLITIKDEMPMHITHVGGVHICSHVYIGDCSCVGNTLFEGATYIGKGAKIDNLVHIAHNLYIGENAVITAHSTLCGSSVVADGAWLAPQTAVLNNVVIGKNAMTGLSSVVLRSISDNMLAYGFPAEEKRNRNV